jgi:poly-gamma-glutamate synthase PgsB/CapB
MELISRLSEGLKSLQAMLADRYANSLVELGIFCAVLAICFQFIHFRKNRRAHRHRRSMPLVVGGWGSRGKSGTERLKAALFNAMGYSVVCKTSGCEPVFLYSPRNGNLEEIPIYRPFDKATIWEQLDLLELAAQSQTDVFLWECMGLEPDYVRIMQQNWMLDDISTITNTYPDHEDIQGPTGLDVAHSICSFIGKDSQVVTTEELMYPIIEARCRELGSRLSRANADQLNALTPDVMERFPYSEHPNNVALVLSLGKKFGLSQDFILKEIADRVKPDIGVLKTYPKVIANNCSIEFANGFSANESYGCLSNWQRLGFSELTIDKSPNAWLTCLVNNREDRSTRSQVFADLLVHELSVDEFYLVGTNLEGFASYYHQSIERFTNGLTFSTTTELEKTTRDLFVRLRVAHHPDLIIRRLRYYLEPTIPDHALEETMASLTKAIKNLDSQNAQNILLKSHNKPIHPTILRLLERYVKWQSFLQQVDRTSDLDLKQLTQKLQILTKEELSQKMIIVPQPVQQDMNALAAFYIQQTPAGFSHSCLGIQNIKGIGLRWLEYWTTYDQFCQDLNHNQYDSTTGSMEPSLSEPYRQHYFCRCKGHELGLEIPPMSHGGDQNYQSAPADVSATPAENQTRRYGIIHRIRRLGQFAWVYFSKPTREYFNVRASERIYRQFAKQQLSPGETRQSIRNLQSN